MCQHHALFLTPKEQSYVYGAFVVRCLKKLNLELVDKV